MGLFPILSALETIIYPTSQAISGQQHAGGQAGRWKSRRWSSR